MIGRWRRIFGGEGDWMNEKTSQMWYVEDGCLCYYERHEL